MPGSLMATSVSSSCATIALYGCPPPRPVSRCPEACCPDTCRRRAVAPLRRPVLPAPDGRCNGIVSDPDRPNRFPPSRRTARPTTMTPRRTMPVIRTPERTAPESRDDGRGPSVSRRFRWALLAALGFVIVPSVYAVAVLTPTGQRIEDAALGGVRESDLFGSDTALNVISVPVILLLVVVIAAVAFARRRLAVGLGAGFVVLASAATSTLLKRIAERPEIAQSPTPNSFPSGHATIALAALFAVLMVTPRRLRPVVLVVGAVYAVFVANQTVVYGWHRVSDIIGACAVALFWLGLVRAVGPAVDRGTRGDRDGHRGPRRVVTVVLLLAVAATVLVGVVALLVGTTGGDHGAMLLAGRMASSAGVLAVITAVWLADGMHTVPRTTRPDGPAVRV
ncbi:hypothetical protein DEI84_09465 [Curtobacterium sp. MCBD17_023]|nr:hypothetical protein DEI84_09465 [Curtobacterium sp. MCBD17_023]